MSVLLVSVGLSHAQTYRSKLPLLENEVHRAVAAQTKTPVWHEQLARLQEQFKRANVKYETQIRLPATTHSVLSYDQEQTYLRRLFQVQKSVRQNSALRGYAFVAPVAADLANLSLDNYAALHAFLKNLQTAKVQRTERAHPFTLAVQIKGIPQGCLELWIDVPTKKVYLMSDNLYTTAQGKYGLHLK